MGGKSSKDATSDFKRTKSISLIGRSSQRSLFQKSKNKLTQLKKIIENINLDSPEVRDEVEKELEAINRELNDVSQVLKDKNKQKYEAALSYFQEVQQKFEEKLQSLEDSQTEEIPLTDPVPEPEYVPQQVQVKLVRVISTEELDVEIRKPVDHFDTDENSEEEPRISAVKFGIQVMPVNPRVSQEMLKRKTLPINEAPKAEFLKIRKASATEAINECTEDENIDTPFIDDEVGSISQKSLSSSPSPRLPKNLLGELQKRQVDANALQQIELISKSIDKLEDKLKYFTGKKGDEEYIELHERFVRSLIKLDSVESNGDSVVGQERKIGIRRVQELMRILECLVKQPDEVQYPEENHYVPEQRENDSVEEKQAAATAL